MALGLLSKCFATELPVARNWMILPVVLVLCLVCSVDASCRSFGKCCPGRDSSCNSTDVSKICYCDGFCKKSGDCCRDYDYYCRSQGKTEFLFSKSCLVPVEFSMLAYLSNRRRFRQNRHKFFEVVVR